ncbi:MAG: hypothetical protein RL702_1999 [Pseudomonadota bacterium]|jgi:hypothetical protein|nr:glycine zipper 2TM domain-containing protein [Novosphingobium sp.]HPZ46801.1 glycine zipper 2TM domain-containing protein [Novosphingobium sp.]HQN55248.1 glycine zipper 2TM domain-containing protein [Novosphingobium sp.]HQQ08064.1 glycine zipper 2TM domain-containing protein [Novosphingobium sp.]
MRSLIMGSLVLAMATPLASGCARGYDDNYRYASDYRDWQRYDYDRPDPRYGYYDPYDYYRDGRYYRERRLGYNDRIYRGQDGRYYCRRSDGTTGLIVGAAAGALLGDAIAPRGSRTIGALIGGALGGAIGHEVESGGLRCR